MTPSPFRCSQAAERRGDTRYATAPPAAYWLLIEHPGPWGRHILTDSGLDPDVARELGRWARDTAGRVAFIRRPAAARDTASGDTTADTRAGDVRARTWILADSRVGSEGIRSGTVDAEADVLAAVRDPAAGQVHTEAVYLVCAHGRHDVCCALRGRPVAAALAAEYPRRVWECSHVGGDRFAANVVLLPHGLYHGHVPPESACALARDYDLGLLAPRWLRGRSSLPAPVQAAQHFARDATGEFGVDSYPPLAAERSGTDEWTVQLAGPRDGERVTVVLRSRTQPADEALTCSAAAPGRVQTFDLVRLCP